MFRTITLATVLLLSIAPCQAELSIKKFLAAKTPAEKSYNSIYIDGAKSALIVYAAASARTGRPAFCLPDKLALTTAQAEDIAARWAKEHPDQSISMSFALYYGMIDTFPCR